MSVDDRGVIHRTYDRVIRPLLPRWHTGIHNGVRVPNSRTLLDRKTVPDYEEPLIRAVRQLVRDEDRVTVIGGGYGVSTVTALEQGADHVTVYEPSDTMRNHVYQTIHANGYSYNTLDTPGQVTIAPRAVEDTTSFAEDTYDIEDTYTPINAGDLSPVDVLVMDCEGVELDILNHLDFHPGVVVVETHGFLGCPTEDVRAVLEGMAYEVREVGVENRDRDCRVLGGVYDPDGVVDEVDWPGIDDEGTG